VALTTPGSPDGPARRGSLDWLRGLAVLVMIEAHVVDAWTQPADRAGRVFGDALILGGFGAPMFLFLAGIAIVLAASGRVRRGASVAEAAAASRARGWQIFGLAFLFRAQAWVLGFGAPIASVLKVDILNVMGPAMAAAATAWGLARRPSTRLLWLGLGAAAVALLTPIVRAAGPLAAIPDPIEWYLRPSPGRTTFTLFPWAGFVFAGAAVGVLLDAGRDGVADRRLHGAFAGAGPVLALVGYGLSFLPPIYRETNFWTSSPTFFLLRTGILITLLPLAWAWERRPSRAAHGEGWLETFGRSSLFVYWIHVEMVYGVISTPLHRTLPLRGVAVSYVLFTAFLYVLVRLKNDLVARRASADRRQPTAV